MLQGGKLRDRGNSVLLKVTPKLAVSVSTCYHRSGELPTGVIHTQALVAQATVTAVNWKKKKSRT